MPDDNLNPAVYGGSVNANLQRFTGFAGTYDRYRPALAAAKER